MFDGILSVLRKKKKMSDTIKLKKLIEYSKILKGDEKGEAQVFCDRLFQAFDHDGYKEAGAVLEFRVKSKKGSTNFADLLWGDRVLIEMKKRGVKLELHRTQAFDYWWQLRPDSPEYVILCNFDEFIIYNFSKQDEPLDKLKIADLEERYTTLNFLFPVAKKPIFENNLVDVTRSAADKVAKVFNLLIKRGEDRKQVQRFILQTVFTMFAEDIKLLPYGFFSELLDECIEKGNSYDLMGGLFRQMANPIPAKGGRFKEVEYFNGGLFNVVEPVELNLEELTLLREASKENWRKVHPAIFGTIFQSSLGKEKRHALGAHYTDEIDIYKVVYPTIVYPWRKKIEKAKTLKELQSLRKEVLDFHVLDPACGSGNFLYIAFRELKRIEIEIINKIHQEFGMATALKIGVQTLVSAKQFHGIDINFFAVELAKVTLMLAKELAIKEAQSMIETDQFGLDLKMEAALPLDNLDKNIRCADALFSSWPSAEVIVGNPPYQSKNKMQEEFGTEYVEKVRDEYPEVPGRADFCVYWFYKAHKVLKKDGFAGLVGTNTIRQNYSREGSLDYIVNNGGAIYNAVSSQEWTGDAVVFVSIVCWKKGEYKDKKLLYVEDAKGKMQEHEVENINSSLSLKFDVTLAKVLNANKSPKRVFQGQTHGYDGFLMPVEEGKKLIEKDKRNKDHLFPYMIGEDFIGKLNSQPTRFSIDFSLVDDLHKISSYPDLYKIIKEKVLPDVEEKAELERSGKVKKNGREQALAMWWKYWRRREDMLTSVSKLSRYISVSRVSKRPIFDFVSAKIRPNDALMVFAFEDDYSFGIIQSNVHVLWYQEKCSTLKGDPRYTAESVWDTFPWPQKPTIKQIDNVAKASKELREERNKIMKENKLSLRELYRVLEQPGKNKIKDLQNKLDEVVAEAYGFIKKKDILSQLLELNAVLARQEENEELIQAPGLPEYASQKKYISSDCIQFVHLDINTVK